ncbi:hypothetical protein HN51_023104 [Arachis hypogaea]
MATNITLKLFLCILLVALLSTSDARSGTMNRIENVGFCDYKGQCNSSSCSVLCTKHYHYQIEATSGTMAEVPEMKVCSKRHGKCPDNKVCSAYCIERNYQRGQCEGLSCCCFIHD